MDLLDDDDEYESLPPTAGPVVHMTAGAMAGMAEHTALFPVDVIKVHAPCRVFKISLCPLRHGCIG